MFRDMIPLVIVLTVSIATVAAQQPTTTSAPATQPAGEALLAVVQQVKGKVFYEPPGQQGPWTPVKVGDRLAPGTRIRTMFRSSVIFTLSDTTVVKVDKIFYRSGSSWTPSSRYSTISPPTSWAWHVRSRD